MSRGQTLVLTGATGPVGLQLLDRLSADRSTEIRLLSRDPDSAASKAPAATKVFGYPELDQAVAGADVVVHLAARNNNIDGDYDDFFRDNCELTTTIANAAKQAGVPRFVFATTTKALTANIDDHYGRSKAAAEQSLLTMQTDSFRVHLARLAPVYGLNAQGRVRHLNRLPRILRKPVAAVLRSAVAVVSVDRAAEGLAGSALEAEPLEELCLSDPLGRVSIYRLFATALNAAFVVAVPTVLLIPALGSAVAVATTSRGGIFFKQNRVGTHQEPFECVKFRTMRTGTPVRGTHEVGESYVTAVGSLLRRFKLDELPQIVNILRRDLNVIGPRPCLPTQTELVSERGRYGVFQVRPGITGYAQVAGVDMSEPLRLAIHDHRYAAFRSVLWDIQIAIRTVKGGGFGDPVGGTNASAAT